MSEGLILWGVRSIFYVLDEESEKEYKCVIKGKVLETAFNVKGRREVTPLVVGDKVIFDKVGSSDGVITSRKDRKNEFKRLKNSGREIQTLVANIDLMIVVDSVDNPPLRPFFIDRCLFSADYMKIPVLIVFNKTDLIKEENEIFFKNTKFIYEKLGYKTLVTSTNTKEGIEDLKNILKGKLSSLNGRSGVGKSSLIRELDPAYKNIKIGEINKKYDRGNHTTTFAQIYNLNFGGKIVDTPGMRELSIFIDKAEDVENYFRDFDKYRNKCHFPNCQHIDEPDCEVLKALGKGKIYDFRYESYLRMRETIVKLKDSRI
jgi:ribosome biogenesis GTPase / thiamine phosphate phosphatase